MNAYITEGFYLYTYCSIEVNYTKIYLCLLFPVGLLRFLNDI